MAGEDYTRLQAFVRGRVQGVFFRDYARVQAQRLGLVGWVRNLPDGRTVELVAEGSRPALEELLRRLREGPPGAHVLALDVSWGEATGEYSAFGIR